MVNTMPTPAPFHPQNINLSASSMRTTPTTLTHKLFPPKPRIPFLPRTPFKPTTSSKIPSKRPTFPIPYALSSAPKYPNTGFPISYLARLTASREDGLQGRYCGGKQINGRDAGDGAFYQGWHNRGVGWEVQDADVDPEEADVVIDFIGVGEGGAVRGGHGGLGGGVKFVGFFPLIMDSMYLTRTKERLRSSGLATGSEGIEFTPCCHGRNEAHLA